MEKYLVLGALCILTTTISGMDLQKAVCLAALVKPTCFKQCDMDTETVAYRPNGTIRIASHLYCQDTVTIADLSDQPTAQGFTLSVFYPDRALLSPDGNWLATLSRDGTLCAWDIQNLYTPKLHKQFPCSGEALYCPQIAAFSTDSTTLAYALNDGLMGFVDLHTNNRPRQFQLHKKAIASLAFNKNGDKLASSAHDDTIKVWHITDPERLTLHTQIALKDIYGIYASTITALTFSPHDTHLVSASYNTRSFDIWGITYNQLPRRKGVICPNTLFSNGISSLAFSPDGNILATGSIKGITSLWDVTDPHKKPIQQAELWSNCSAGTYVRCLSFSPDGNTLITGDRKARPWKLYPEYTQTLVKYLEISATPEHIALLYKTRTEKKELSEEELNTFPEHLRVHIQEHFKSDWRSHLGDTVYPMENITITYPLGQA